MFTRGLQVVAMLRLQIVPDWNIGCRVTVTAHKRYSVLLNWLLGHFVEKRLSCTHWVLRCVICDCLSNTCTDDRWPILGSPGTKTLGLEISQKMREFLWELKLAWVHSAGANKRPGAITLTYIAYSSNIIYQLTFSVVFYTCMHNASVMFLNFLPDVMSIYG